jgi:hypothetical protein
LPLARRLQFHGAGTEHLPRRIVSLLLGLKFALGEGGGQNGPTVKIELMNRSTQLAQRLLEEWGYLVMEWHGPKPLPSVGEVLQGAIRGLPGEYVEGPFLVAGHTTVDELRQQVESLGYEFDRRGPEDALGFLRLAAE